jgi:hypothetical protein
MDDGRRTTLCLHQDNVDQIVGRRDRFHLFEIINRHAFMFILFLFKTFFFSFKNSGTMLKGIQLERYSALSVAASYCKGSISGSHEWNMLSSMIIVGICLFCLYFIFCFVFFSFCRMCGRFLKKRIPSAGEEMISVGVLRAIAKRVYDTR